MTSSFILHDLIYQEKRAMEFLLPSGDEWDHSLGQESAVASNVEHIFEHQ